MRIAVCLSGHLKFPELGVGSLRGNILRGLEQDIFVCSYNTPENISALRQISPKKFILHDINKKDEISPLAEQRKFPETRLADMYAMFRNIRDCFSLVDFNYDVVIRARSDVLYGGGFSLDDLARGGLHIPRGGDWRGGMCDIFAIGTLNAMRYYCRLYDFINYYIAEGVNAHPETLLREHLTRPEFGGVLIARPQLPLWIARQGPEGFCVLQHASSEVTS